MTDEINNLMSDEEYEMIKLRKWAMVRDLQTLLEYGDGEVRFGNYRLTFDRNVIPPAEEYNYRIIDTRSGQVVGEFGYDLAGALYKMTDLLATSDINYLGF
jgi:hypothetical protein